MKRTSQALFTRAAERGQVSAVVLAHGVASRGRIDELRRAEWDRILTVNTTGSFLCAREAARIMRSGSVVFLSSQAGRKGAADWGAYAASKFAVIGLMESFAQEQAPRRNPRERDLPGSSRHPDVARHRGGPGTAASRDPLGAFCRSGRSGRSGGVSVFRRGGVHDRFVDRDRRRGVVVTRDGLQGVSTVLVAVPDNIGRLMGKRLPIDSFLSMAEGGMPMPDYFLVTWIDNQPQDGFDVTGWHTGWRNCTLHPDFTTLRTLPWDPSSAIVLCDTTLDDGSPAPMASRQLLATQVDRALARRE